MEEYSDPTPIATAEQFKAALLSVRDSVGISQKDLDMLRAHCRAPNHTITAGQLAQVVDYPNHASANMQYGTLAHRVADALHHRPGPFPDGKHHWWRTLAYGNDVEPQTDTGHYEWIMRSELVQALQDMKWA